jgi:hypothetical protein
MREQGVRGILIYCAEYRCSHSIAISGDPWPDDVRLSNEPRFVCQACGKHGADGRRSVLLHGGSPGLIRTGRHVTTPMSLPFLPVSDRPQTTWAGG